MKTDRFVEPLHAFISDQDGVTSIEYALLAALIFAVIVITVGLVGKNLAAVFQFLADAF